MSTAPKTPMLKAAGLWAKSSVKGGQYLTGRLGGMKVQILENRDRQKDDDLSHHFFAEAAPRPDRQERTDHQRPQPSHRCRLPAVVSGDRATGAGFRRTCNVTATF
jgi:hypothetical protein